MLHCCCELTVGLTGFFSLSLLDSLKVRLSICNFQMENDGSLSLLTAWKNFNFQIERISEHDHKNHRPTDTIDMNCRRILAEILEGLW